MFQKQYPYYLGNKPVATNKDLEVVDTFSGQIATRDIHKAHLAGISWMSVELLLATSLPGEPIRCPVAG